MCDHTDFVLDRNPASPVLLSLLMSDRHALRREFLQKTLRSDGCDAILVSSVVNVGYLTGFSGDSTPLLLLPDRTLAISDFRYVEHLNL